MANFESSNQTPKARAEVPPPIERTPESVSYLGVKLLRAERAEDAPKPEHYADFIDDDFSLELQRKIATSWLLGQPILIEAGTSIGKTTTVRKMCADLGYEVHYVNLNGATDVEDLMGRYVPNKDRKGPADPEYVFADGKVTSGLRQEEGKRKVIILDEYNSAKPNILIRLHEALDALERNGEVVLSEDAAEKINVSKESTKIVALTNPPGKGYLQREPLDPAQIRRWNYQKEVSELPAATFKVSTQALFGFGEKGGTTALTHTPSVNGSLTLEQLKDIRGIDEILAKYMEFHTGAKTLLQMRNIAKDQPQRFTFDDREEPKRVRDFVQTFYTGDINQAFQTALRYYYSGKLLDESDKNKLEELIRHVHYTPPVETSRRVPLDALSHSRGPEVVREAKITFGEAERIMGDDLIGPEQVEAVFNERPKVFPIPFSKDELMEARARGGRLTLQPEFLSGPLDWKMLMRTEPGVFEPLGYYESRGIDLDEKIQPGWVLTIPSDATNQTQVGQFERDVEALRQAFGAVESLDEEYLNALLEFDRRKELIRGLNPNRQPFELSRLQLNKIARQSPLEIVYADFFTRRRAEDEISFVSNQLSKNMFISVTPPFEGNLRYSLRTDSPNYKSAKVIPSLVRRF